MKKFLVGLSLLITCYIAKAERISHVTFYTENHERFNVYLNDEKKTDEPSDRVRLINLTQKYYKLRIVFTDPSLPPIEKNTFVLSNGDGYPVDAIYVIKANRKGEIGLHWVSQTTFPEYIETNKPTVIVVNGGAVQTETTRTVETTGQPNGVNMSFGVPGGSVNVNTGGNAGTTQHTTTTTTAVVAPTSGGVTSCTGTILGEDDFKSALKSIGGRSTEDGKLLSAKQIVSSSCMTTANVKRIMQLFAAEDKKLEIAKYAYDHTIDKGNYFKLNDEFKVESNIDELNKAIVK